MMRRKAVLIFLAPSFIGFLLFFLIPFIGSLYYACNVDGMIGLDNLFNTFQNEAFQLAMGNTLKFMLIAVPLNLLIPLLIAIAVKTLGEKSRLFRLAYISPMVVPVASVALFWKILFSKGGTVNQMFSFLGLGQTDFLHSDAALFVIVVVFLWKNLGYMMVLYLAGLSEIPPSYYESASMDGAVASKKFFHITLPCLRPTIFFVLVLSFINSFKVFREIFLIAGQYPDESIYMLQHYMNNMFEAGDYPRLTTAAFILTFIIVVFLFFMYRLNRRIQKRLEV